MVLIDDADLFGGYSALQFLLDALCNVLDFGEAALEPDQLGGWAMPAGTGW